MKKNVFTIVVVLFILWLAIFKLKFTASPYSGKVIDRYIVSDGNAYNTYHVVLDNGKYLEDVPVPIDDYYRCKEGQNITLSIINRKITFK